MPATERRKHTRYDRDMPISVFDHGRRSIETDDTVDISVRGLGLRTGAPLKPGERIHFSLSTPAGPVVGRARVRWVKPHHAGFLCGAEVEKFRCFHQRRLRLYLEPESFDGLRVFDRMVTVAALVVAYLALVEFFGLPVNPFRGLQ